MDVITNGLTFHWDHTPVLREKPWFFSLPRDVVRMRLLFDEISDLKRKNAIEKVLSPGKAWYSLIFLVPKKNGKMRPVFDLSCLNRHLMIPRFRMESALTVMTSLRQHLWVVSLDIKDAYLHVPIHPAFRKYLHLAFLSTIYRFRVLPFGISTAPYTFTRIVRDLAAFFHSKGIIFHHYLDDWLIVADSPQLVSQHLEVVIRVAQRVGWIINWEKSQVRPTQTFTYVGIHYDLHRGLAFPPLDRLEKLECLLDRMLRLNVTTARQVLSLIGHLASMEKQIPWARGFMRPIQWGLATQWRISKDPLDQTVTISQSMKQALLWWKSRRNTLRGLQLMHFVPDIQLATDASQTAWGAHWNDLSLSGQWTDHERRSHINVLELKAVLLTCQAWQEQLQGRNVMVFSDNSTVVAHINKQGGTRSRSLSVHSEALNTWAFETKTSLRARHIPGKRNVVADSLSRPNSLPATEWSLSDQMFERISSLWFRPLIDLFATRYNFKVRTFFSPVPDDLALGVDAFSHSWDGLLAYAFPPVAVVPELLRKFRQSDCQLVLVAPRWPKQHWYPDLLSRLIDHPREIPLSRHLLKQPRSSIYHLNPGCYNLHVWRLSNKPSKLQEYLRRCPITSLDGTGNLPETCTTESGECSVAGVISNRLIPVLPL